jgi:hypothetical protein
MSPEISPDSSDRQLLIDHLINNENPIGQVFARSLIELYATGDYAWYCVDTANHEEPETETSAMAWRFIIADEDYSITSPVLSIVSQEKNQRLINFMRQATLDLKELEGQARLLSDKYQAMAISAAGSLGLRTLAAMEITEDNLTHEHITRIAYPEIYQEVGQIDVLFQSEGVVLGDWFKKGWGIARGASFLKQTPFSEDNVFCNL